MFSVGVIRNAASLLFYITYVVIVVTNLNVATVHHRSIQKRSIDFALFQTPPHSKLQVRDFPSKFGIIMAPAINNWCTSKLIFGTKCIFMLFPKCVEHQNAGTKLCATFSTPRCPCLHVSQHYDNSKER